MFLLILSFFLNSYAHTAEKKESAIPADKITVEDISKSTSGIADVKELSAQPAQSVRVIASRLPSTKRRLEEIPYNVTYIGKEDLEDNRPLRFQEAVEEIEGVTFFDAVGNDWDTTFGLRGFTDSSRTVFLVDGVRVNEVDGNGVSYPLLVMNDVESIQIDRGSASPVYGSNAFAGVVNITSGMPGTKPIKFFGGAEWDSFGGLRFNQGVSGTLEDKLTPVGGKWKYYFNGGRNVGDGWRENDEFRFTNFDVKTGYELADHQGHLMVGAKHVDNAISNPGELTFQQFKDNPERTNKPLDGRHYQNTIIHIDAEKKFWDNHITASVLSSWRPNKIHFYTTSGTFTDGPFNPDTDLVTTKSRDNTFIWQTKYEDYWKEVYNETQLGMEFRDQTSYSLEQDAFGGNVVESSPHETEFGAEAYNAALFWRETLKFFEKVIPYFGMRHDFNWLKTQDFLNPLQDSSRRWNKSTFSAGITVNPVSFTDLFFNYSQGFRVPTINDIIPFNGTISTGLRPEESSSYEVGTRLRYKSLAASKTSFFVIDLKDEIAFDSNVISPGAPFGQNVNIGKSRRYGIEQRIDLKPIKELKLYGSYTWLRAYVRETGSSGSPVDGRELGQIPENRFTIGAVASPLARLGENFDGFKVSLRGVFTGRQHPQSYQSTSQANLNAAGGAGHFIKSYSVFDFMLLYERHGKMIYFKVNNIFDEKYYSRSVVASSFSTALYPSGTYNFVNPGAPREFVLGSKWEF